MPITFAGRGAAASLFRAPRTAERAAKVLIGAGFAVFALLVLIGGQAWSVSRFIKAGVSPFDFLFAAGVATFVGTQLTHSWSRWRHTGMFAWLPSSQSDPGHERAPDALSAATAPARPAPDDAAPVGDAPHASAPAAAPADASLDSGHPSRSFDSGAPRVTPPWERMEALAAARTISPSHPAPIAPADVAPIAPARPVPVSDARPAHKRGLRASFFTAMRERRTIVGRAAAGGDNAPSDAVEQAVDPPALSPGPPRSQA
jgi:hypothetical protein